MQTLESINQTLTTHDAVMLYFSAPTCNVCHALKPKLTEAVMDHFPTFIIESIDISETPEIAYGACLGSVIFRFDGVGAILDHHQVVSSDDVGQCIHLAWSPRKMHRHHRPRALRHRR